MTNNNIMTKYNLEDIIIMRAKERNKKVIKFSFEIFIIIVFLLEYHYFSFFDILGNCLDF